MRALKITLALALSLTACSSGGSDSATTTSAVERTTVDGTPDTTATTAEQTINETTSTPPAPPSLEDAVRAYTAAFLGGDGEAAYGLLTERCQGETAKNDFADIVTQAQEQYGDATITGYAEEVNGNTALATYELSDPILNQTEERWILEADGWHNDEC